MRKTVALSSAIKFIVVALALVLLYTVLIGNYWTKNITETTPRNTQELSQVINYKNTAMQAFVANHGHFDHIRVYLGEGTSPKSAVEFTLTDSKGHVASSDYIYLFDYETMPEYLDVAADAEVIEGEIAFLKVKSDRSLYLPEETWLQESGIIAMSYYNDELVQGSNLVVDYVYTVPLSPVDKALFAGIIILVAAVLWVATALIFKHKEDRLITVEKVIKCTMNPAVAVLLALALVAILAGKVSSYGLDNVFAVISVIFLGIILFYAINHDRTDVPSILTKSYIFEHIPDFIQSLAVAGALQACCLYVSGLYDINHRVAERREMLWFALIIIAMYSAKEIFNFVNLIYVLVAAGVGAWYYRAHLTTEMLEDEVFVLKASVAIGILLGFIVLRTIFAFIKKKFAKPDVRFLIPLVLYFAAIIVFRNTRWWTVALVVGFSLLFINYGLWEKRKNFITNVIRGVVLQFLGCMGWVWLYRPFVNQRYNRFAFYFHTSTIAATYLTMVIALVTVLLFAKIRKCTMSVDEAGKSVVSKKLVLKEVWKELLLFGTVASYLVFTAARTAFAAAAVTIFVALLVMFWGRKNCVLVLKTIGLMLLAVVLCFPVLFEIQRDVPALVSEPYAYEIEQFEPEIVRGRNLTGDSYITVGKEIELLAGKLLNIGEDKFDFYNNKAYTFDEENGTAFDYYERTPYDFSNFDMTDDDWDKPLRSDAAMLAAYNEWMEDYYSAFNSEDFDEESAFEGGDEVFTTTGGKGEDGEYTDDYTNGRIDIYKAYISQLNMTGHDSMNAIAPTGEELAHAHDVYLQVAFDHGIPTAVIFLVFGAITFILGILYYKKNKADNPNTFLSVIMLTAFAVAGVVEWTYHLSHPMAFVLWLSFIPLLFANYDVTVNLSHSTESEK